MFVRQKQNKSGTISIQVIDKTKGYRVVKTMGSSKDPEELERLTALGHAFIARRSGQYQLFPKDETRNATVLDQHGPLGVHGDRQLSSVMASGKGFQNLQNGFTCPTDPSLPTPTYPGSCLRSVCGVHASKNWNACWKKVKLQSARNVPWN